MRDPRFLSRFGINVNVNLGNYTAIGCGGRADFFVAVDEEKAMVRLLQQAAENNLKTIVIGTGTQTVFSDHGVRGLVVQNRIVDVDTTTREVKAGAGIKLAELINRLAPDECGGFEALAGYPGSLGSAIRSNAHVDGFAIADAVVSVRLYSGGSVIDVAATDMRFGPEDSRLKQSGEVVIGATLRLTKKDASELKRNILTATQRRLRDEPSGPRKIRAFRDPGPETATELASAVGTAGEKVGGAVISTKNPNYIVNEGDAKAADVYELAGRIKHRVSIKLQKKLVEAVSWHGEW